MACHSTMARPVHRCRGWRFGDSHLFMSNRSTTVDVLLPYALEGCYSYAVPPHLEVVAGDFVQVPLGTRQTVGVVWREQSQPASDIKLKPITARFGIAPLPELSRRFIEWIAAYYLEPVGNILRL